MTPTDNISNYVLHDIRGPVFLSDGMWWMFFLALGVVLGVWFFILGKGKKIFKPVESLVSVISPWEIALKEIACLEKGVWESRQQVMEFYVRLSASIRSYIERRFNIRAVAMTTEEFMEEAQRSSLLTGEHKVFLKEFLFFSDIVKFAGSTSSSGDMKRTLEAARAFVVRTIPAELVGGRDDVNV